MNDVTKKQGRGSVVVKIIIGVVLLAGVIWLITQCATCH